MSYININSCEISHICNFILEPCIQS